ncbi:MAG: AMP-binding protein, partial [Thermodesulfobacteriota bacterium]
MILAGGMIRWPAEHYPDKTAVKFEGREMTFREVNERINRLANGLIDMGLKRGDRVAALLYNSPRAIETRFALMKAGLCMVPINIRQTEDENAYIINHSQSDVVILDGDYLPNWERMRDQCRAVRTVIVADCDDAAGLS